LLGRSRPFSHPFGATETTPANSFLSSYARLICWPPLVGFVITAARPLTVLPPRLALAGDSLAHGEPVLLFDAPEREGETDLLLLAEKATPELIRLLRNDAGGLVCTVVPEAVRVRLGLPFFAEVLEAVEDRYPLFRELKREHLRYDRRSAFGISVNHRTNFTGVPDNDRATTIRALGELVRDAPLLSDDELRARFVHEFTSPGHVPLLHPASGLLEERKGHTELAICLARMADLTECVTVCEMLGDSGGARSPEMARRYADEHGWVFLEGRTIVEAWREWSG
jgi:3,4-dihydroxy 2-butanone 4-phosphate synthase